MEPRFHDPKKSRQGERRDPGPGFQPGLTEPEPARCCSAAVCVAASQILRCAACTTPKKVHWPGTSIGEAQRAVSLPGNFLVAILAPPVPPLGPGPPPPPPALTEGGVGRSSRSPWSAGTACTIPGLPWFPSSAPNLDAPGLGGWWVVRAPCATGFCPVLYCVLWDLRRGAVERIIPTCIVAFLCDQSLT